MEGTKLVTRQHKYALIGETISVETVFVQAATALDIAAQFAEETKDAAALIAVAQIWVEMGAGLISADTSEENVLDLESKNTLGFESESMSRMRKEREIEDDGTESKLARRMDSQHGGLRITKAGLRGRSGCS